MARGISQDDLTAHITVALTQDLFDGFYFLDIKKNNLIIDGINGGLRFDCAFHIGNAPPEANKINKLSRFHIDVGFGDEILKVERQIMPAWLSTKEPISWLVYPLENMFSEKLETMCKRGSANSRAKDIFDLIELFPLCKDIDTLNAAVETTFNNRKTDIPRSFYDALNRLNLLVLRAGWQLYWPQQSQHLMRHGQHYLHI